MTAVTQTGEVLLTGFSDFIGDHETSVSTAAGAADGSSLVDTVIQELGQNSLEDWYVRLTDGAHDNEILRIAGNSGSTITFHSATSAGTAIASGTAYSLHRYDPERKFDLLDRARVVSFPLLSKLVYDETVTGDGWGREIAIPSTILRGPVSVFGEVPLSTDHTWNFLTSPQGDSLTGWTVAGGAATAALYAEVDHDLHVPKYDQNCTRIVVPDSQAVTYTQVVGDMETTITAPLAAGREMLYAKWVYCTLAARVTLNLIDDTGTVGSSPAHGGGGWELLTVAGTIDGDNATTLSVQLAISSGAVTNVFWNRSWLMYGDKLPDFYHVEHGRYSVRRDGTTQEVLLRKPAPRKRQLRMVGRGLLSELGTATPQTSTMELDELAAELLYAFAARELYRELGNTAEMSSRVAGRIQIAELRLRELQDELDYDLPNPSRIQSPYL